MVMTKMRMKIQSPVIQIRNPVSQVTARRKPIAQRNVFNTHLVHPHAHIHRHLPRHHHGHLHLHSHFSHYHAFARYLVPITRIAYCPKQLILQKTCTVCKSVLNTYSTYFIHTINENKQKLFQFIILYSDLKKEVIITFSGPKTSQSKFFNKIYQKGFTKVKELGNIKIEKYYWKIYNSYIRKILFKKIKKIKQSKRGSYKFIFVGHSFGGSIATLAALDLVKNQKIKQNKKKLESPIVYSYGPLRIGDTKLVDIINSLFKVIRIVRSDDFIVRAPSCVYDMHAHKFKCFTRAANIVKQYPLFKKFFAVYRKGLSVYRKTIIKRIHSKHSQFHAYYTQPLGTMLYYSGDNWNNYQICDYKDGIPICEKNNPLPKSFSPNVHSQYFSINLENC